jgi:peptide/nickel transport system substrate-binding protein
MARISRRHLIAGVAALPLVPRFARGARTPDTLVFGLSSFPPNLLPWASTGTAALTVKTCLFRGLLSFGPDGKVRGELAEKWEPEGEHGWVFHLRDATFHNGAPVTADDVKWTLEQMASEKGGAYLRGQLRDIAAIETPDPRTVRLVTKTPVVTMPLTLATPFAPIIAKDTLAAPVGAGPYILAAQERGVSVDLQAFPKYYKPGTPKLKHVRFIAYADENARVAALQTGDVDMIEYVPWQSMSTIEADPKLTLSSVDGPYMALAFNGGSGPFKDARLRQAAAFAIRREEIVKATFFGRGTVLEGLPITKQSDFYNETYAHGWKYDPDHAKKLMAEAGVGGGFACTLLATAQYGMHKSTAEIVQQHLGEVGIAVTLNLPDWATRVSLGNRGQYEFCVQGQAPDNNDPDGLSAYIDGDLPPDNARSAHLPTPRIHELLAQGRAEFDPAKRHAIYDEMQKVALEVVPLAGLCWRSQGYAMARDVTGFSNLPGGLNFYSGYSLENVAFT